MLFAERPSLGVSMGDLAVVRHRTSVRVASGRRAGGLRRGDHGRAARRPVGGSSFWAWRASPRRRCEPLVGTRPRLRRRWLQEAIQTVHMVAAGVWIGGFVPILVLLRARRRAEAPAPIDEVRRFSSAAGWAVLVVVATGLVRVVNEEGGLGSVWSRLTDSSYGTTLIVKVAVVVVVIALGAWNRLRSIPRLADGDRLLARVMTAEAVGALVIVVTTGLLTGLNPEPAAPRRPQHPRRSRRPGATSPPRRGSRSPPRPAWQGRTTSGPTSPTTTPASRSSPPVFGSASSPWDGRRSPRASSTSSRRVRGRGPAVARSSRSPVCGRSPPRCSRAPARPRCRWCSPRDPRAVNRSAWCRRKACPTS